MKSQGDDTRLKSVLGRDLKGRLSLLSYVVSIPLSFVERWLGVAIFVGVAVTWFIPDRRVEDYLAATSGTLGATD